MSKTTRNKKADAALCVYAKTCVYQCRKEGAVTGAVSSKVAMAIRAGWRDLSSRRSTTWQKTDDRSGAADGELKVLRSSGHRAYYGNRVGIAEVGLNGVQMLHADDSDRWEEVPFCAVEWVSAWSGNSPGCGPM
jgi:hypothetical protein